MQWLGGRDAAEQDTDFHRRCRSGHAGDMAAREIRHAHRLKCPVTASSKLSGREARRACLVVALSRDQESLAYQPANEPQLLLDVDIARYRFGDELARLHDKTQERLAVLGE